MSELKNLLEDIREHAECNFAVEMAINALKEIEEGPEVEWYDMASAPKKGDFLVYLSNGHITAARLINEKYLTLDSQGVKGAESVVELKWTHRPKPPKL